MWGGGFWGTEREDQWRRRKEKEQLRTSEIRHEEERIRINLARHYKSEILAQNHVLDLTRRLLSQSRKEEERKRLPILTSEVLDDDDSKPSATKRARFTVMQDLDNERDDCLGSSIDPKHETEAVVAHEESSLELIRENLLALCYAMFDSLFATDSFQAKAFCEFLLKAGERSLAEQIGLAAVEKSYGGETDVRFVLFELAPQSDDAAGLVERVTSILKGCDAKDEGKEVLVEWQAQHGNSADAFKAALQIEDEVEKVKKAYPLLEGKPERRQQLKAACRSLHSNSILGVFLDEDWPDFLVSGQMPVVNYESVNSYSAPTPLVYINYAAKKMSPQHGKEVAVKTITRALAQQLCMRGHEQWANSLPAVSHAVKTLGTNLVSARVAATELMSSNLSDINRDIFQIQDMMAGIESLGIDAKEIVANFCRSKITLPPPANECTTHHRDVYAAFKCKRCRDTMYEAAWNLGLQLSIRHHELTKDSRWFLAIGCVGDIAAALKQCGVHPDAVSALLSDTNIADFARQTTTCSSEEVTSATKSS